MGAELSGGKGNLPARRDELRGLSRVRQPVGTEVAPIIAAQAGDRRSGFLPKRWFGKDRKTTDVPGTPITGKIIGSTQQPPVERGKLVGQEVITLPQEKRELNLQWSMLQHEEFCKKS